MTSGKQTFGDDLEGWADVADSLCKLKMANDGASEFATKFSKYLSPADKVEIAALNTKYNAIYWKYWEKLIKKIRGL